MVVRVRVGVCGGGEGGGGCEGGAGEGADEGEEGEEDGEWREDVVGEMLVGWPGGGGV